MSLLDDVSIVVTPNGYKAGELYAVIPVPTEGANIITPLANSDFSSDTGYWNLETNIDISGGLLNMSATPNNASFYKTGIIQIGKTYKVEITISGYSQGFIDSNNGNSFSFPQSNGTHTIYFVGGNTALVFSANGTTTLSVDNVSVKEYTSADMDVTRATAGTRVDENGLVNYAEVLGGDLASGYDFTSWSTFGGGTSIINSTSFSSQSGQGIYKGLGLVANKTYKIKITGTQPSGGYFSIKAGTTGTSLKNISTTSFNEEIFATPTVVTASNNDFYIRLSGHSAGSVITISNLEIQEVTRDNVPRIDYTGGGCPHILAEPQRTNLIPYSEAFDNAYWTKSGATVENGFTSPDGTENAYKLKEDTSVSTLHYFYTSGISVSSTTHNFSVFVKSDGSTKIGLRESSGTGRYATFDLINKSVISQTGTDAKIEELSNDWLRLSFNDITTTSTIMGVFLLNDSYTSGSPSDNPYTGDGTSGVYIFGAQLEEGSYTTSYIPTSGSSVTRNQDIFTRDGIGSLINSTEGVLFLDMAALSDDGTNRVISLYSDSNNRVSIFYSITSNTIFGQYVISGSSTASLSFALSDTTLFSKIAFKYKENDFALWVDGVEVDTDSSGLVLSANTLNNLDFNLGNSTLPFLGKIKQLQVYDTALTDMQLIQLTGTAGTDFYESYSEMAESLTYTIQ